MAHHHKLSISLLANTKDSRLWWFIPAVRHPTIIVVTSQVGGPSWCWTVDTTTTHQPPPQWLLEVHNGGGLGRFAVHPPCLLRSVVSRGRHHLRRMQASAQFRGSHKTKLPPGQNKEVGVAALRLPPQQGGVGGSIDVTTTTPACPASVRCAQWWWWWVGCPCSLPPLQYARRGRWRVSALLNRGTNTSAVQQVLKDTSTARKEGGCQVFNTPVYKGKLMFYRPKICHYYVHMATLYTMWFSLLKIMMLDVPNAVYNTGNISPLHSQLNAWPSLFLRPLYRLSQHHSHPSWQCCWHGDTAHQQAVVYTLAMAAYLFSGHLWNLLQELFCHWILNIRQNDIFMFWECQLMHITDFLYHWHRLSRKHG